MSERVGIIVIFAVNEHLCLSDDTSVKEKPAERSKEKKVVKPVRKVQKVAQFSSPECRTGGFSPSHVPPEVKYY